MIETAKAEIDRRMRQRLREEATRLPAGFLAAGQYLDLPTYEQRGLYGTAAAILVLAEGGTSDAGTADLLTGLASYVINRSQAERQAVSATVYRDYVARRLRLQRDDTFRLADLAFSLASVSPSVPTRNRALESVMTALRASRAENVGYAIGAESTEPNPLATAHVLRALVVNNMPIEHEDWRYLREYLDDGDDIYIKCFVIYVLSRYHRSVPHQHLRRQWKALFRALEGEFRGNSEANFEYTRLGQQDYVRIPWQLYLIQACSRIMPLARFNLPIIQHKIGEIARAVTSPTGFRYEASGPNLSTRTYACVYQMLCDIEEFNLTQPIPRAVIVALGTVSRVISSRVLLVGVVLAMCGVASWSVADWARTPDSDLAELAPNLLTELFLATLVWAGIRLRNSGR
ncbi:hypothetical protein ABZ738_24000 [Micromonospora sp. NPDC047793]|uniref:hypothetical protein n=1 Tax=Micromonospora sp. NPDC047793 TaxID=3154342 RepID=UPI0033DB5435